MKSKASIKSSLTTLCAAFAACTALSFSAQADVLMLPGDVLQPTYPESCEESLADFDKALKLSTNNPQEDVMVAMAEHSLMVCRFKPNTRALAALETGGRKACREQSTEMSELFRATCLNKLAKQIAATTGKP